MPPASTIARSKVARPTLRLVRALQTLAREGGLPANSASHREASARSGEGFDQEAPCHADILGHLATEVTDEVSALQVSLNAGDAVAVSYRAKELRELAALLTQTATSLESVIRDALACAEVPA